MCEAARAKGIPALVDPKGKDYSRYRGATVTPTEDAKANLFPTFGYEEWDGQYYGGTGQAVRLEEFDVPRHD